MHVERRVHYKSQGWRLKAPQGESGQDSVTICLKTQEEAHWRHLGQHIAAQGTNSCALGADLVAASNQ